MSSFEIGEHVWTARLGNLRNTIRQEVIARQLADHVESGMTVLDVGCGQGTQALRLAARGCTVTGVDASADLLGRFADDAATTGVAVELINGQFEDLGALLGDRRFDVVCAHGLLMYLPDRATAIRALADRLEPDGRLSLTFRNGDALAMRPALRQDWAGALAAFESDAYVNELGVTVRADRLADVTGDLSEAGLQVVEWYGVRVFNDAVSSDEQPPSRVELALLLDAEDQAGHRDPYRWMGSQTHVIAGHPR